ncbi:leucine-rich repeat-containing protein 14-like protein [Turdus rufiventris]|nr:leucine-rich repeat-containing protein 14-like protein [Turdus rufiventris]
MDSLVFLCVREVVTQHPLPTIPAHLYPVIFELTFLAGILPVLQDLVATWPFPVLKFRRPVGQWEHLWEDRCCDCIKAVIQAVVVKLRRVLDEPSSDSSGSRLRTLDMTGVPDDPATLNFSLTQALAKACLEVNKHHQELQRHRRKRRKGCSGATTATPQVLGVDVHTDLFVKRRFYRILCEALQTGATGPLRIKCHEIQARDISASETVTLLKSLDTSCLRRVHLQAVSFGLTGLSAIMPHLSRFPELRSLVIQLDMLDLRCLTWKSAMRIHDLARQLGMLPGLRELNLRMIKVSGNLHQILCDLQAPLESLNLGYCCLVPNDLTFLSQSIHAPTLKNLDLSGLNVSQGLLEPLQLLLEETSASLLQLDLSDSHMADSHLAVLLPTLLRCSRLRLLGLYGNSLSTAALKDLLQKTLELPDLHLVVYPIPVDYLKPASPRFGCDFVLDEELLEEAEAEFSQVLVNSGRTDLEWTCSHIGFRAMDYFSLGFGKTLEARKAQSLHHGKVLTPTF